MTLLTATTNGAIGANIGVVDKASGDSMPKRQIVISNFERPPIAAQVVKIAKFKTLLGRFCFCVEGVVGVDFWGLLIVLWYLFSSFRIHTVQRSMMLTAGASADDKHRARAIVGRLRK